MNTSFHAANRRSLTESSKGGLYILTAYTSQQEHNDVAFPFRQESNFYYLTGIIEPDWLLVIDSKAGEEYLIAPDIDEIHAVFEGSISYDSIATQSGIGQILDQKALPELLKRLASGHKSVYTVGAHPWKHHFNFSQNPAQARLNRRLGRYFEKIEDCRSVLAKHRAIKQPQEVDEIKRAIDVTGVAFKEVERVSSSLHYEYEMDAVIGYQFRKRGLPHAFQSVVASGRHACTMHHVMQGALEDNKPILIDAGATSNGYAADISRTFAYGQSNERQIEIYDELYHAHQKIIELLRPGLAMRDYLTKTDEYMKTALSRLGLDQKVYREYFPHAISHGLGLDVHESLGGYDTFQTGMVLTVEPGIYITEEGIGMRIEDDILITANGHDNLSASISTEFNSSSIIKGNL